MTSLAFEFSSDRRSVALGRDGVTLAEAVHETGRQTPVLGLVDHVLRAASLDRRAVERVVVSVGPGSYTGIRIAISAAQGWVLGTGASVVAVDSFEALRHAAARTGLAAPWTAVVDAQRQEFAVRTWDGTGWVGPLRLAPLAELTARAAAGERLVGPDADARLGTGPGVVRLLPEARDVLAAAVGLGPVAPESLAPVYLREAAFLKAPPGRDLGNLLR